MEFRQQLTALLFWSVLDPVQWRHVIRADDTFLEQEVDDAERVDVVDDFGVKFPELELQHLVRL